MKFFSTGLQRASVLAILESIAALFLVLALAPHLGNAGLLLILFLGGVYLIRPKTAGTTASTIFESMTRWFGTRTFIHILGASAVVAVLSFITAVIIGIWVVPELNISGAYLGDMVLFVFGVPLTIFCAIALLAHALILLYLAIIMFASLSLGAVFGFVANPISALHSIVSNFIDVTFRTDLSTPPEVFLRSNAIVNPKHGLTFLTFFLAAPETMREVWDETLEFLGENVFDNPGAFAIGGVVLLAVIPAFLFFQMLVLISYGLIFVITVFISQLFRWSAKAFPPIALFFVVFSVTMTHI